MEHSPEPAGAAPTFGRDAALKRLGGRETLLRELIKIFLRDVTKYLTGIRDGVARHDAKMLHWAAHTLHGSCRVFEAPEVLKAARELEEMGNRGDFTGVGQALAELEKALDRLIPELKVYVGESS
ncbi:MAG: Hpt domain-containing protein [Planctomycetes bacterium]|nr:Hpt domain-containing protein [Planctomycetota bacterium]